MTFRFPHWFVSAFIAFAAHFIVFLIVLNHQSQGALAEGKQGIEIDLGMLGDFGETIETKAVKMEPVRESVLPLEKPSIVKERTQNAIIEKTEKREMAPVVQESQVLVSEEKDITEPLREEARPKDDTILVDEPVLGASKAVQETPKDDLPIEKEMAKRVNEQNLVKQTTGQAESLHTGGQSGIDQSYLAKLLAQLAQHKRYPFSSRKKAEEGVAVLDFELSRTGRVVVSKIQKSSGFHALDKAVLVMLKRAEPFPPVPPDIKGDPIRFTLPISFKLNG